MRARHQKQLYSKKYGVHLARFTHKSTAIIHASTKEDGTLHPCSLSPSSPVSHRRDPLPELTRQQLRPLLQRPQEKVRPPRAPLSPGSHQNAGSSPCKCHLKTTPFSPARQTTPSVSGTSAPLTPKSVPTLSSRSSLTPSQGLLNIAGNPCVAYDPSGSVFGVALNLRSTLLLYDLKNFDKMPFLSVQIEDPVLAQRTFPPRLPVYTSLSFSNDGKWVLIGTSGDVHYVVDAFEGGVVARLEGARFSLLLRRDGS